MSYSPNPESAFEATAKKIRRKVIRVGKHKTVVRMSWWQRRKLRRCTINSIIAKEKMQFFLGQEAVVHNTFVSHCGDNEYDCPHYDTLEFTVSAR